jgi:flagellar hook assembly protein FlgD
MKKLLLLSVFTLATFVVNAQEISDEQWTLVSKRTADWCTFCGGWGWTFKDNLLEDQEGLPVVFWMVHYSGGLMTPTAKAISDNFGGSGQPVFFLNNDNMNVGSFNTDLKREEFKNFIESYSLFDAFAGVGSTATFDGEKITTKARAQILINLEGGEYWLSSYLVDDELIAYQQSQGQNAKHQNVLLHSFNGTNYFGENVANGAVNANQEFIVEGELDFTGQDDIPNYADGYSVVTILWTRVNGKYTPLNLNRQPITSLVSTKDILQSVEVTAFHLGAGQVSLNITSDQNIDNARVNLYDINGQVVAAQKGVQINSGENQLILDAQELTMGTYVVVVESEKGSRSIKVSVR